MRACYDLARSPPTYDVTAFLCQVEMNRRQLGDDRVDIEFAPGPIGGFRQDKLWPPSVDQRERLLWNIAVPMCRLLPACSSVRVLKERAAEACFGDRDILHMLRHQVQAFEQGIRPLRPIVPVARTNNLVTITLREAEHWSERNSNVDEWIVAAEEIEQRGYEVVFVRDTVRADSGISGFGCNAHASHSVHARAELYASAFVNLGVSNGPLWMAMALDAGVIMLRPVNDKLGATHSAAYFVSSGIPAQGQIPGAPSWQRLVWVQDRASEIVSAFDEYVADSREWTDFPIKKKDG
jgi:hypothetical protein